MIVAGFGFRASVSAQSLRDVYDKVAGNQRVSALATVTDKARLCAFKTFAQDMALPILVIPPHDLAAAETATQSSASRDAWGTGSVAEASALAAAGLGARLLKRRLISADRLATCALAQSASGREDQ
ncbi:MAG: cobalamin biosynthesis protein [Pseudomonadota bacterium]